MDAITSISPYSRNPEARRRIPADVEPFSRHIHESSDDSKKNTKPSSNQEHESSLSAISEACLTVSKPATCERIIFVKSLIESCPDIVSKVQIFHDKNGQPIQAFPALALAAIQGEDPEGWALNLCDQGVCFDTRVAKNQARIDLLERASSHSTGMMTVFNARCESLSIWTLACAKARYIYSALKALKEIRSQYPQLIAPIKSELDSFKDMHSESPSLSSHDRCKVFVMAAYCENDFIEWIINWIHCERGSELMDDAKDLKKLLNEKEIKELTQSLNTMNTPQSLELATLLTP